MHIFGKRLLVVAQADHIRLFAEDYSVASLLNIPWHDFRYRRHALKHFNSFQQRMPWDFALNLLTSGRASYRNNQKIAIFFGLFQKINVAGVQAIKDAKNEDFFHVRIIAI